MTRSDEGTAAYERLFGGCMGRDEAAGHGIVAFYVLAVAITTACSFACWVVLPYLALGGVTENAIQWIKGAQEALFVIACCGPSGAALIVASRMNGRAGVKILLHCPVRRASSWGVLAVVLAAMPVYYLAPVLVGVALGDPVRGSGRFSVSGISTIAWIGLIVPAFGEEIGWRAFLQPRLKTQFGDLVSCVLVAGLWWLWHYFAWVPMAMWSGRWAFLSLPDSLLSLGSGILPMSVILYRLYQWTGQSIIAVMLAHGLANLLSVAQMVLFDPERPMLWYLAKGLLWVAGAVAYLVHWEARAVCLVGRGEESESGMS
ncbi:MAG: CPBP family intramembrane metalloprotease [Planctomycetes bacterium]|nr:CPBP family intramembrane metalloprotease [Planctomycetota bacterium]